MSEPVHTDLIAEIDAYCVAHGLSETRFGVIMMRDPRFVSDLRRGRELRRRTEGVLRAKMAGAPEATQ